MYLFFIVILSPSYCDGEDKQAFENALAHAVAEDETVAAGQDADLIQNDKMVMSREHNGSIFDAALVAKWLHI